jgi:ABC-type bacteriocin/lantibiotic exporter with double-glycine peptidase domain
LTENSVITIHRLFSQALDLDDQSWEGSNPARREANTPEGLIKLLDEHGRRHNRTYFLKEIPSADFSKIYTSAAFPMIIFLGREEKQEVVFSSQAGKTRFLKSIDEEGEQPCLATETEIIQKIFIRKNHEGKEVIPVITSYPVDPVLSQNEEAHMPVGKRFFKLLTAQKREISYIYLYAIISGIISLSLPLGIQSLVGFTTSGQVSTSIVVLITFIVLGIIVTGILQVLQLSIVEYIQQRLFTRTAFEFAFRIPRIKIESVLHQYAPELMNRFFDVITLQKGLAKILIDFTSAGLQILFGILLLSFYHPYFIFFGILLITVLIILLRFTGPQGLQTSLKESKYKYQVAGWLEEIARAMSTFKLASYSKLPMQKTDHLVGSYLNARKKHFKILVIQYYGFVIFKTLITAGLLILGVVLIVNKEINIGQFVASEIIIILIMSAVEKMIVSLDTVYDVLTSLEKIGHVTDLPIDPEYPSVYAPEADHKGIHLKIDKLSYRFPGGNEPVLKDISIDLPQGSRLCVSGFNGSGKRMLINMILGIMDNYEGRILFNGFNQRDLNRSALMKKIGDNVSQEDLFEGTVIENITLGDESISHEEIRWAMALSGLERFVSEMPNGLATLLHYGWSGLPKSLEQRIILTRSLVHKPDLLLIDDFVLNIDHKEKKELYRRILSCGQPWTVILVSNDPGVAEQCDKVVVLRKGKIEVSGSFSEVSATGIFHELID